MRRLLIYTEVIYNSIMKFKIDEKVVVGKVMKITPHPNANNLRIVDVMISETETVEVVCGADNYKIGDLVPLAKVGAMGVVKRNIRGIDSNGMMCAPGEIGIGDDMDNILILPKKLEQYLGKPLATVDFDVEIKAKLNVRQETKKGTAVKTYESELVRQIKTWLFEATNTQAVVE